MNQEPFVLVARLNQRIEEGDRTGIVPFKVLLSPPDPCVCLVPLHQWHGLGAQMHADRLKVTAQPFSTFPR